MTPYQAAVLIHHLANIYGVCHSVPVTVPVQERHPQPTQLHLLEAPER